jgi:DNA-binding NarL/FixJ family response regulator
MQCTGTNLDGQQCRMIARQNGFCFHHDQLARAQRASGAIARLKYRAEIFALAPAEIAERISRLTGRELEALEYLCGGETYKSGGDALGITDASFTNRVAIAIRAAGVRTRSQLICLYSIWRVQNQIETPVAGARPMT